MRRRRARRRRTGLLDRPAWVGRFLLFLLIPTALLLGVYVARRVLPGQPGAVTAAVGTPSPSVALAQTQPPSPAQASSGRAPAPAFPFTPLRTVSGIPSVHDGDTITVSGTRIRLNGVDAEELSEPHGAAARAVLQDIIGIGSPVECGLNGEKTWDRDVGVCINRLGQDVGAELIRRGHALDCEHFSKGRYRPLEPAGARASLISKPYCR